MLPNLASWFWIPAFAGTTEKLVGMMEFQPEWWIVSRNGVSSAGMMDRFPE
jgi:hypothetical protein